METNNHNLIHRQKNPTKTKYDKIIIKKKMNTPDPNEIGYQPSHLRNNQFKNSPPTPLEWCNWPSINANALPSKKLPRVWNPCVRQHRALRWTTLSIQRVWMSPCVNAAALIRYGPFLFLFGDTSILAGKWDKSYRQPTPPLPYSEKLEINPYIGKSDTNQNPHWVRVITGEALIRVGFNISNQEGGLFVYPCLMNELGLKGVSLKCIALRFYVLLRFLDLGHWHY